MLRTVKPRNARSKRFLEKREPKVNENPKTTLIVRGSTTSKIVNDALNDLKLLKKSNCIFFGKKNEFKPFDDKDKVTFFSQKNDASLIVVGTHQKKRPHNLVFVRTFNHEVLDMYELGIEASKSISEFKGESIQTGLKPMIVFNGDRFDTEPELGKLKNYFLDFFNGEPMESVHLDGLVHVISFTATPDNKILMRSHKVTKTPSGSKTPRVELEEIGPRLDFVVRRTMQPQNDVWNSAVRVPKELQRKKKKNVEVDEMGDVYGRVHMGKQNLHLIQTRKVKGLKKRAVSDDKEEVEPEPKKQKQEDTE